MEEANKWVKRDGIRRGRMKSWENLPGKYKVSKEFGQDVVEGGDGLELLPIVVGQDWSMIIAKRGECYVRRSLV